MVKIEKSISAKDESSLSSGMVTRCGWPVNDPQMMEYHDNEWGVPIHDDNKLFEVLSLDGAQAGLSWSTILKRRDGYRKAFDKFNIVKISRYGDSKVQRLLTDQGIIRNRTKIKSAINNANRILEIKKEFKSFDAYIWSFVDNKPIMNRYKIMSNVPANTELSDTVCADLKKRGLTFVGSTICYAFMQSVGMVNDHVTTCFRYKEIESLA